MLLHEDNAPLSRSRDACQVKKGARGPAQPPTVAGVEPHPRHGRVHLGRALRFGVQRMPPQSAQTATVITPKPAYSRHIRVTLPVRDRMYLGDCRGHNCVIIVRLLVRWLQIIA